MLLAARNLVDRLRHPRTRALDVAALRSRLAAQPSQREAGPEATAIALELASLREELHALLANVESCGSCSRGHPLPHGRWDGGHCCGCRTEEVFTDEEVAALALSGLTPSRLPLPSGDHAGCAFRGPTACSLPARDRPTICVRYTCIDLRQELKDKGEFGAISAIQQRMVALQKRFEDARNQAPR